MDRKLIAVALGAIVCVGCGNHDKSNRVVPSTSSGSTSSPVTTNPSGTASPTGTPGATGGGATGGGTTGGGSTGGGTPTPGLPPSITLQAPASPASGNVALTYTLTDVDSDRADLQVEYSVDAGVTWSPATDAGPSEGSHGTTALTTTPTGEAHTFVWSSVPDAGRVLRHFVQLRFTPSDPNGQGNTDQTPLFILDDTAQTTRLINLVIPLDPQGADTVSQYDVGTAGSLTLRPTSALPTAGQGRQMSSQSGLVASRGLVFASHNRSSQIEAFVIGANQDLTPLPGGVVTTAANPTQLAVTPNGRFLYTTNGSAVEGFVITPTGLTPVPGSPYAAGSSPRGLVVHPRGDTLYTGHMFGADEGVRAHTIDPATGALTLASSLDLTTAGSRPGKHLVINPEGTLLYCSDLDNGIFAATVDPTTHALTLVRGGPLSLGGFLSGAMTMTTHGDYLYVSVTGQGLHGYRIGSSGSLTPVPGSPFTNIGSTSLYLRTDPADSHLFTSSRADDTLRVYSIDRASGVVTEVAGSPLANRNSAGIAGPVLPLP